jgi:hypothetical protein
MGVDFFGTPGQGVFLVRELHFEQCSHPVSRNRRKFMVHLFMPLTDFLSDEDGRTTAENAVMLAVIVLICLGGFGCASQSKR